MSLIQHLRTLSHFDDIHDISQFSIIIVMVITDVTIVIAWVHHKPCPHKTADLTNKCSVHSDRSTDLPFTAFLPLWASYSLRHNIESRPVNNLTMAPKCSSETKSLTFLKLNQKLAMIKLSEKGMSKDKTGLKAGL